MDFIFWGPYEGVVAAAAGNTLLVDGDMSYFHRGLFTDGPTKFRFIWPSGFRGEEFFLIDQSETRIACCGNVCLRIGTKCALFIEGLP